MQDAVATPKAPAAESALAVDTSESTRRIRTQQFGEIEVTEQHIFYFNDGLFGFQELKEFVLVSEERTEPLKWLLSLDNHEIGFPVISPFIIDLNYRVGKEFAEDKFVPMVIITLANARGKMTANMKAPVVLDVRDQSGRQIIMSSDRYSPEYPIEGREQNVGTQGE